MRFDIVMNEPDTGELSVNLNDPDAALLTAGRLIKMVYRGYPIGSGGFFIENIADDKAASGDRGGQWKKISGRGGMVILDDAVVWSTTESSRTFTSTPMGSILLTLINEAKVRGCFPSLRTEFSAALDSNGDPWTDSTTITLSTGTSLLDVARQFAELGLEFKLLLDWVLGDYVLYVYGTAMGVDKSADVVVRIGHNAEQVSETQESSALKNAFLVTYQAGITTVTDAISIAAYRRREAFFQAGNAPSSGSALILAGAELEARKDPVHSIEVKIDDGVNPPRFDVDYQVGDWIGVDWGDGAVPSNYRIRGASLEWTEDKKYAGVTLTLNSVKLEQELRTAIAMRKIANGSIGGGTSSAPVDGNVAVDAHDADASAHSTRPLAGDLGGTIGTPSVKKLNGVALDNPLVLSNKQILKFNSASNKIEGGSVDWNEIENKPVFDDSLPIKEPAIGSLTHITGYVTIIDNTLHNGFLGACILADGKIIVVYRAATNHSSVNGSIKSKSSTDGGVTWGAETTIYTHATLDARDPNITRLRNGNLVLTVKLYNWGSSKPDYSVILISTNNGSSWGSAIAVGEAFSSYGGCSSPVIEIADNVLLLATFGLDSGETYEYTRLLASYDGAISWTNIGIIAKSSSRHYQEPNLCALPNGELLCFLRSNTVDHFYICRSSNGGATWTTPVDLFNAGGRPNIFRLANGALFLCYRQKSVAGDHTVFRISLDNGFNWSGEQAIDTSGICAYSAVVETNAGSFGLIFSVEQTTSNSDIFYTNFYSSSDFVPSLHASRHQTGGTDPIKIDDLAAPDDNTDLDASTTKHGLMKKFPGGTTDFLRADGAFTAPPGGSGSGDVVGPASAIDNHLAVFDGTTGKLIKDGGAIPAGSSTDGWVSEANTWTYSSADAPTFVASVNADLTGILSPGMRIKLTQTTVKYFIVTAVGAFSGGATLITLYGGTDYTLANAAITSPFFSTNKAPFGFPLDPAKWTTAITPSNDTSQQTNPTQNTWYNLGSLSLSIPIGIWKVKYTLFLAAAGSTNGYASATLSTANNSESNVLFTTSELGDPSIRHTLIKEFDLILSSKTTYYLNESYRNTGGTNLQLIGTVVRNEIRALCAYL